MIKFYVKFLSFTSIWIKISNINDVNEGETTAGYKNFIVVEDQEYFVRNFLQIQVDVKVCFLGRVTLLRGIVIDESDSKEATENHFKCRVLLPLTFDWEVKPAPLR